MHICKICFIMYHYSPTYFDRSVTIIQEFKHVQTIAQNVLLNINIRWFLLNIFKIICALFVFLGDTVMMVTKMPKHVGEY
jgi:hypothetical protein